MEIVLALILGMGAYQYMKADDVDPTKHLVVDPQTRIELEGQWTTNSYTRNLSDHKDVKWVFEVL
jgi:hypothetical protein